jgi:hypothetical protein
LRWNKPKEALEWFYKSAKLGGSSYLRAGPYLAKLQRFFVAPAEGAGSASKPPAPVNLPEELITAAKGEQFEEESILNSAPGNPHFPGSRPQVLADVDTTVMNTVDAEPEIDEAVLADLADLEMIS